jgi:hypothetical protein
MGKIKSAFELAMEKTKGLGELSQEELEELRKKERVAVGERLAQKYLEQTPYRSRELRADIDKCGEEARKTATQAFLRYMSQAVALENYQRPLQGILDISGDRETEQVCREIEELCHQYQRVRREMSSKFQERLIVAKMKELDGVHISGSAIKMLDVESSPEWQEELGKLHAEFDMELEQRKQNLNIAVFEEASGG